VVGEGQTAALELFKKNQSNAGGIKNVTNKKKTDIVIIPQSWGESAQPGLSEFFKTQITLRGIK
jgi:hypothetical protein